MRRTADDKLIQLLSALAFALLGASVSGGVALADSETLSAPWATSTPLFAGLGVGGAAPSSGINVNTTLGTDATAPDNLLMGTSAYPQAGLHQAGGKTRVAGGVGSRAFVIVTASNLSGKTFTIVAGSPGLSTTLTDGSSFTHSGTNATEATNLAAAITANVFGVTATAVSATVYITPSAGTRFVQLSTNAGSDASITSGTDGDVDLASGTLVLNDGKLSTSTAPTLTIVDGANVVLASTTGTKIGTATSQKLGFYNATPVVQATGSTDVLAGLVTVGLRAVSSNPPLDLGSGAITAGATTVTTLGTAGTVTLTDGNAIAVGTSSGTKIGTSTSQKLGFFNATPVVQESGSNDVLASLVTLGLRASSSNPPLNLGSGTLTAGGSTLGATTVTTLGTGGNVTLADGNNVVANATTGSKIGTATSQKLGFWNATPVVQTTGATDVLAGLVTVGLRAASSNPPLNLGSGALTAGASTLGATTVTTLGTGGDVTLADGNALAVGTSSGTKIGTATSQKLGFFNATPVVQQTGSSDVLASLVTLGLRAASSNPPLNLGSGAITAGATSITTLGTAGDVTLTDGNSIVVGSSSGTKIGTSTSQKIGFFNSTPVVQEAGSNDVLASMVTLGLRAASSNPPLNLGSGMATAGSIVVPTVGTTSAANVNLQYNSGTSLSLIGKPATSAATTTLQVPGVNGGSVAYGVLHTSTTLSTGATTTNLGVNVPAGSVVYATSCRVTTLITTAATFNLEDAGGHFYGSTITAALNSTGVYGGPPATASGGATLFPGFYSTANTFKIVCNATPAAGVVETIIYYYTITAPTS